MPGTFEDPLSDFGRLGSEIWRAVRLVVDTGLHAKGWTEQEAIDYFLANTAAPEGQARSEVRRYIVLPGQATSYKIGMIKIQDLRRKAEADSWAKISTFAPSTTPSSAAAPCRSPSWSAVSMSGLPASKRANLARSRPGLV